MIGCVVVIVFLILGLGTGLNFRAANSDSKFLEGADCLSDHRSLPELALKFCHYTLSTYEGYSNFQWYSHADCENPLRQKTIIERAETLCQQAMKDYSNEMTGGTIWAVLTALAVTSLLVMGCVSEPTSRVTRQRVAEARHSSTGLALGDLHDVVIEPVSAEVGSLGRTAPTMVATAFQAAIADSTAGNRSSTCTDIIVHPGVYNPALG